MPQAHVRADARNIYTSMLFVQNIAALLHSHTIVWKCAVRAHEAHMLCCKNNYLVTCHYTSVHMRLYFYGGKDRVYVTHSCADTHVLPCRNGVKTTGARTLVFTKRPFTHSRIFRGREGGENYSSAQLAASKYALSQNVKGACE
jgi:hypothetical protein